jgi:hypothetical protein
LVFAGRRSSVAVRVGTGSERDGQSIISACHVRETNDLQNSSCHFLHQHTGNFSPGRVSAIAFFCAFKECENYCLNLSCFRACCSLTALLHQSAGGPSAPPSQTPAGRARPAAARSQERRPRLSGTVRMNRTLNNRPRACFCLRYGVCCVCLFCFFCSFFSCG